MQALFPDENQNGCTMFFLYTRLFFSPSFTENFPVDGNSCIASGVPSLMNPITKPATTSFNNSVVEIPRKRKGSDSDNQ